MQDVTRAWMALGATEDRKGRAPVTGEVGDRYVREVVLPLAGLLRAGSFGIVGMAGPPGSGKSTLAGLVAAELADLDPMAVSIDDFYLPRNEREDRDMKWRGPPGSHDLDALVGVLEAVTQQRPPLTLPRFSFETDDRADPEVVTTPPRLFVLEGWYVGYPKDGYERILPYLGLLVYLDVDIPTARSRRFGREAGLRARGGGFKEEEMLRFWNEVLEPGIATWGAEAKRSADLVLEINGRVVSVRTSNDAVLAALA